jgi:hypothetical protein
VLEFLEQEGVRIVQTPFRAPNCNAHAERFVRSIKEECLARIAFKGSDRVIGHYARDASKLTAASWGRAGEVLVSALTLSSL